MGAAINDIIDLVRERAAARRGRRLTDDEPMDPCGPESRQEIEDFLRDVFGCTAAAKNTYRDWARAVGCRNERIDYDVLLGACPDRFRGRT